MGVITVVVVPSLQKEINRSDPKTKKLFEKQRIFMEKYPYYNSLGRTKLQNVKDKYDVDLEEIRLDKQRRIVLVKRDETKVIWLKICSNDELIRTNIIRIKDDY